MNQLLQSHWALALRMRNRSTLRKALRVTWDISTTAIKAMIHSNKLHHDLQRQRRIQDQAEHMIANELNFPIQKELTDINRETLLEMRKRARERVDRFAMPDTDPVVENLYRLNDETFLSDDLKQQQPEMASGAAAFTSPNER